MLIFHQLKILLKYKKIEKNKLKYFFFILNNVKDKNPNLAINDPGTNSLPKGPVNLL